MTAMLQLGDLTRQKSRPEDPDSGECASRCHMHVRMWGVTVELVPSKVLINVLVKTPEVAKPRRHLLLTDNQGEISNRQT